MIIQATTGHSGIKWKSPVNDATSCCGCYCYCRGVTMTSIHTSGQHFSIHSRREAFYPPPLQTITPLYIYGYITIVFGSGVSANHPPPTPAGEE